MAAEAASGDEHALSVLREVRDLRVLAVFLPLVHGRAGRHLQLDVDTVLAGSIRALAVAAASGLEDFLETEIEERVEVGVDDEVHRSAGAAVATARAAARNELFAAERHGAPAAMAGCDVNIDFVYEHARVDLVRSAGCASGVGVGVIGAELELHATWMIQCSSGSTLMTRPRAP